VLGGGWGVRVVRGVCSPSLLLSPKLTSTLRSFPPYAPATKIT